MNQVVLSASVAAVAPLRYTPAGVPALDVQLSHVVAQPHSQDASIELSALSFGLVAQGLARQPLGTQLKVRGFLRHAGRSKKLMLQIEQFETLSD